MKKRCIQEKAFNLAVLRIFTAGFLLFRFNYAYYVSQINLPVQSRVALPGYSEFFNYIPLNATTVQFISIVYILGLLSILVGYKTRAGLIVTIMSAIYILGLPLIFGKINHGFHHVIWILIVLTISPCFERLSIDSLRKKTIKNTEYEYFISSIWAVLSIVYFFPGFWKLLHNGLNFDWATKSITLLIQKKWFEYGENFVPALRIDLYPNLITVIGIATIGFELLFLVTVFFPKTRVYISICAIFFHKGIEYVMKISFANLWVFFIPLQNWYWVLRKLRLAKDKKVAVAHSRVPVVSQVVVILLCSVNIVCGIFQFDSWPIGVYPLFNYTPDSIIYSVNIELVQKNNKVLTKPSDWQSNAFGGSIQQRIFYTKLMSNLKSCNDAWNIISSTNITTDSIKQVRFIKKANSIFYANKMSNPINSRVLCTVNL